MVATVFGCWPTVEGKVAPRYVFTERTFTSLDLDRARVHLEILRDSAPVVVIAPHSSFFDSWILFW